MAIIGYLDYNFAIENKLEEVIMGKKSKAKKSDDNSIALNRKARHDYFIEQSYEAGLMLEGWEVKSIRQGRANLAESYVIVKRGQAWLIGAHITPLDSASTHVEADPIRSKKLLLHKKELNTLIGHIERKGYTLVPLKLYWKGKHVKLQIGLAKGKKQFDKRDTIKQRDWQRDKARLLKNK